jgi:hypothetical protein
MKGETQMKKQLATALILGAGLVPDVHADQITYNQSRDVRALTEYRISRAPLLARRAHFDRMKSAGKLMRRQIAAFSLDDDGLLLAEWSAPLQIPSPMRIETEELDAEWMALAPAAEPSPATDPFWLLARRDLQPHRDGRFWFVRLYAAHDDPTRIDVIATTEYPNPSRRDAVTITYSQSESGVRLQSSPTHRLALDLTAPDLRHLIHNHRQETRRYLTPALQRITNLHHLALS